MASITKLTLMSGMALGLLATAPVASAQYNSGSTYGDRAPAERTTAADRRRIEAAEKARMEKERMMAEEAMMEKDSMMEKDGMMKDTMMEKDSVMKDDAMMKDEMMMKEKAMMAQDAAVVVAPANQAPCPAGTTLQPNNTCMQN